MARLVVAPNMRVINARLAEGGVQIPPWISAAFEYSSPTDFWLDVVHDHPIEAGARAVEGASSKKLMRRRRRRGRGRRGL